MNQVYKALAGAATLLLAACASSGGTGDTGSARGVETLSMDDLVQIEVDPSGACYQP